MTEPTGAPIDPTGNIVISIGAIASLGFMIFKIRKPFKKHSFNTFAYIIMLLIAYSLLGNYCIALWDLFLLNVFIVRAFFFFIDFGKINPKIQGFLATYPCINLVICSYLLSNQW